MKEFSHLQLFAQKINAGEVKVPVVNDAAAFANIINAVYMWAGIICVVVIIIGAFFYTTSGGNAKNVQRGKDAIIGAVVGLVIVLMAFGITQFVLGSVR